MDGTCNHQNRTDDDQPPVNNSPSGTLTPSILEKLRHSPIYFSEDIAGVPITETQRAYLDSLPCKVEITHHARPLPTLIEFITLHPEAATSPTPPYIAKLFDVPPGTRFTVHSGRGMDEIIHPEAFKNFAGNVVDLRHKGIALGKAQIIGVDVAEGSDYTIEAILVDGVVEFTKYQHD